MPSDQTEARRARVRTLWVLTDRKIAERLIEESFSDDTPHTTDGKRKQLDSMTRNVWNDRAWWRKHWREVKRATSEDACETRGEYLANLDSYREIGVDMLADEKLKGTPRVQALMALTRIEEARAKASGVAEVEVIPPEDPDAQKAPFLGVVVGVDKLSPEALRRIDEWSRRGSG